MGEPGAIAAPPISSSSRTAGLHAEVIVVGGGPAGSSTAWHLAQLGLDVMLLDRARFPRDKACAEYLSPAATRILESMGAVEPMLRAGAAGLAGMHIRSPNGTWLHGEFGQGEVHAERTRGLSLRRTLLDAILLERARLAGATVHEGTRVTELLQDTSGRVCGVRVLDACGASRDLRAALVIGADGLRSVVARRLGVARRRRYPRRMAFVGHFEGVAGMGASGEMHVEHDGFVGMANVGNGESNAALVVPHDSAREAAGDPSGFLRRWLERHSQLAPRFSRAREVAPVMATGPFASYSRRAWVPGAALVGDAAEYFDPFTGEGIWSALRGGELLAPRACDAVRASLLGRHREADAALRAYAAARRSEFMGRWVVERLIAATVATPALMNRAASTLSRRKEMADLLVGVTGDMIPARAVLTPSFLVRLFVLR